MPVQELTLPALVKHKPKSLHLHALICEVCGTQVEFDPLKPDDFEQARNEIQHHRCKNQ